VSRVDNEVLRGEPEIGCVEEVALRMGFVDLEQFSALIAEMPRCPYREYLEVIAKEYPEHGGATRAG